MLLNSFIASWRTDLLRLTPGLVVFGLSASLLTCQLSTVEQAGAWVPLTTLPVGTLLCCITSTTGYTFVAGLWFRKGMSMN